MFWLGVQIAAPVLSATLAADIMLGLLGKASPQMPLMLLGPAIKSLLGISY
jgi:flagellar biosynthesis protein FliR